MSSSRFLLRSLPVFALAAAAMPSVADAGIYAGVGVGKAPAVRGDVDSRFSKDGNAGRLVVGARLGYIALEAEASRAVLAPAMSGDPWYASTLAASLKLLLPVGDHLELFGRGGLGRSGIGPDPGLGRDADTPYVGTGIIVGGGLQYRFGGQLANFSIWGEYSRQKLDLSKHDDQAEKLAGSLDTAIVGVAVGI